MPVTKLPLGTNGSQIPLGEDSGSLKCESPRTEPSESPYSCLSPGPTLVFWSPCLWRPFCVQSHPRPALAVVGSRGPLPFFEEDGEMESIQQLLLDLPCGARSGQVAGFIVATNHSEASRSATDQHTEGVFPLASSSSKPGGSYSGVTHISSIIG